MTIATIPNLTGQRCSQRGNVQDRMRRWGSRAAPYGVKEEKIAENF
jgi:hypothetical protein